MVKVLIVDDEPDILEFLSYNLTKNGFDVKTAENGELAIEIAKTYLPQVIVLDIMMPGMSGIDVCRKMRKMPELDESLITILTARQEDQIQIEALNTGADDFISKPLKPSVFLSRLQALLRRKEPVLSKAIFLHDLVIDPVSFQVNQAGQRLDFPKKEFEILYLLASKPGKVFKREEILRKLWGNEVIVGDRTIDVHIRKLREKLGGKYIQTIKGVGYKFVF